MSADADLRERAAKTLLGGKGRIEARAAGYTPAEAACRWYSDDALEAVEAALEDDRVAVTDDLLAAVREDAEVDDATAASVTADMPLDRNPHRNPETAETPGTDSVGRFAARGGDVIDVTDPSTVDHYVSCGCERVQDNDTDDTDSP